MNDLKMLLANVEDVQRRLKRRGFDLDVAGLTALDRQRRDVIQKTEELRTKSKAQAREFKGGDEASRQKAQDLRKEIQGLEVELQRIEGELEKALLQIPNIPSDRSPDGLDESAARHLRTWGEKKTFAFKPKDHVDLGESLQILELERAAKISGARFSVLRGAGAALERAIASFLLDTHGQKHGYTEVSVPYLVSRKTMTGTGQLPKFEADLFKTQATDRELFLIPTAEVPVTNLHADEVLKGAELPITYCCHSACFRAEAGSHGRDTRGLIRQHQFHKVELVRFCKPEQAWDEHAILLGHAEQVLKDLGLHYRVMELAAGDTTFSAEYCCDIEVWLPSEDVYREISSVSNYGQYQARRAAIRYKETPEAKAAPVATLNGSALPIGRTLIAILEQYQEADGSVTIPEPLRRYTGFTRILPGGKTA